MVWNAGGGRCWEENVGVVEGRVRARWDFGAGLRLMLWISGSWVTWLSFGFLFPFLCREGRGGAEDEVVAAVSKWEAFVWNQDCDLGGFHSGA